MVTGSGGVGLDNLRLSAFGEARVYELFEGYLLVEHAGFNHHVADELEIGLVGRKRRVHYAVQGIRERPAGIVVGAGDQLRAIHRLQSAAALRKGGTIVCGRS